MPEPIKRIDALKSLSRDHHYGLLLCWKIREGIRKNIQPERIKKYADWFWKNHLKQHFEIEEKLIFPILGKQNKLIKRALAEHKDLQRLFENDDSLLKSIRLIEKELEKHIRFEERVLFIEIQKVVTDEQLKAIGSASNSNFRDNAEDEFWKN